MAEQVGLPIRADLAGLEPYGAPQVDVRVRLNVNENPYPPSAALVADIAAAVADAAAGLNRYPDRDATGLRAELAGYLRAETGVALRRENLWAANGSNEIMLQLMQAFGGPGHTALGFAPTYSMYPQYCRDTFTTYVAEPREADFGLDPDRAAAAVREHRPDLVLLCSPNNPTGTMLALHTVSAVLAASTGVVVVDEAYAEFRRPGSPSAVQLLDEHPRLIVVRTLSKAFGLAGARVGYLAAGPEVVDALRLVRLPYHLSAVTQAVAIAALGHSGELAAQLELLRAERDEQARWLSAQGYEVPDSDANFLLFGRFPDRHIIWQGLLDRGVLVRETGPTQWLRVTIGTPQENAAFRAALQEVTA